MKILLVTEKYTPHESQRDGGATLVKSLVRAFGQSLSIMQFGSPPHAAGCRWYYPYTSFSNCRFEQRLLNASSIGQRIFDIQNDYTHILFIHISMQFGILKYPLHRSIVTWTFPMFLTPSYLESGETVPAKYTEMERRTLAQTHNILTPSQLEKKQMIEFYNVGMEKIHIVPRGIDTTYFKPQVRHYKSKPLFCSLGSIKPQKNTLGLVHLFSLLHQKYAGARLRIIGPIQNRSYENLVREKIESLKLRNHIEFLGFIPPQQMSSVLEDCHLHLSMSNYETFGRSIFETLASGLPNVAHNSCHAATEYLTHLPYMHFADTPNRMIQHIDLMLTHLDSFSRLATEIGDLYNDRKLSQLMVAKIKKSQRMVISDFDGTLYHKDDPLKTKRSFSAFKTYPLRVICSARSLKDILKELKAYEVDVHWIIGYSGALIANGSGQVLYERTLNPQEVHYLKKLYPKSRICKNNKHPLQLSVQKGFACHLVGYRIEHYLGESFVSPWESSKLHAVHKLLDYLNWQGQVLVFGDGPYDQELLTYFDGIKITPYPKNNREKDEVIYVSPTRIL